MRAVRRGAPEVRTVDPRRPPLLPRPKASLTEAARVHRPYTLIRRGPRRRKETGAAEEPHDLNARVRSAVPADASPGLPLRPGSSPAPSSPLMSRRPIHPSRPSASSQVFRQRSEATQIAETQMRSRQCVLLLSDNLMHCQAELNHVAVRHLRAKGRYLKVEKHAPNWRKKV